MAAEKIAHVTRMAHRPVLVAHAVLTQESDPAREFPALAEATLDLDGTLVRARAVDVDMGTAIDELDARLRRRLVQDQDRERTRHRWTAEPEEHEWKHGDLPTPRRAFATVPPEEREVRRRKTFAGSPLTPDEAAFEMDLLGHDFYAFVDRASERDAVVWRRSDGRYALAGAPPDPHSNIVGVDAEPPPVLTEDAAKAHLDLAGDPFVFYRDPSDGRGRVMYLRLDGNYGVITTA
jgi:ribosome-associated translation inhibitor RaiA